MALMEEASLKRVDPVKLCKDCRWVERGWFGGVVGIYARCMHDKSALNDDIGNRLVTGCVRSAEQHFASTMRLSRLSGRCGPDAKLFEPRR